MRAYRRICERADTLKSASLAPWLEALGKLNVMEFIEDNEGNAIRIFETVNDRGRPLATIEKVKSYLIYVSNKYLNGDLDASLNERFGRVFKAYDRIKDGGTKLNIDLITQRSFREDSVLRYHFLAYPSNYHDYGITPRGILDEFLKVALKNETQRIAQGANDQGLRAILEQYSLDLALFFEAFADLIGSADRDSKYYKLFTSIPLSAYLYPLTVRLHMRGLLDQPISAGSKNTFLDAIETADVRVYKTRGTSPEKDVSKLASESSTLPSGEIATRLRAFILRFMSDAEFRFRLGGDVYEHNFEGARHILLEYDELLRKQTSGAMASIAELKLLRGASPTLDHILAREPTYFLPGRAFQDEGEFLGKLHQLGNLCLAEKRINSSAQKKTPEQKAADPNFYPSSGYGSTRRLGIHIGSANGAGKLFGAPDIESRTSVLVQFCLDRWALWQ